MNSSLIQGLPYQCFDLGSGRGLSDKIPELVWHDRVVALEPKKGQLMPRFQALQDEPERSRVPYRLQVAFLDRLL